MNILQYITVFDQILYL